MNEDKRFYRRGRIEVPVTINNNSRGKTISLSLGGALCNVSKHVITDTSVSLVLFTQGEEIDLTGKCISCRKVDKNDYIVALEFDKHCMDPTGKKRRKLSQYLGNY